MSTCYPSTPSTSAPLLKTLFIPNPGQLNAMVGLQTYDNAVTLSRNGTMSYQFEIKKNTLHLTIKASETGPFHAEITTFVAATGQSICPL